MGRNRILGPDRTGGETVDAVLRLVARASDEERRQRCLHPACSRWCVWLAGRGRPPLFCSSHCRRKFAQQRNALLRETAALAEHRESNRFNTEQVQLIEQTLAKLNWALKRYPEMR